MSGRADELHEILKGLPEVITLSVRPRQGQLFEGGTRVDLATSELINRVAAGTKEGDEVLAQDILDGVNDSADGAPLAQAAVMGGTHQKRKPRTGVN